jgi:hypothetical protein
LVWFSNQEPDRSFVVGRLPLKASTINAIPNVVSELLRWHGASVRTNSEIKGGSTIALHLHAPQHPGSALKPVPVRSAFDFLGIQRIDIGFIRMYRKNQRHDEAGDQGFTSRIRKIALPLLVKDRGATPSGRRPAWVRKAAMKLFSA